MSAPVETGAGAARWIDYDFAVLRLVPRVEIGAFVPVGVVLHARTAGYLAMRVETRVERLAACAPGLDVELLARYLRACEALCRGDAAAGGPMALAPTSERFVWLTAPRSDVLQCSPVHEGVCEDLERALERLYREYVEGESWRGERTDASGRIRK